MKHKNNKLQIWTLVIASVALIATIANTALFLILNNQYSTLNNAAANTDVKADFLSGKINMLTKCAHGDKHFCDIVTEVKPSGKNDGQFKYD